MNRKRKTSLYLLLLISFVLLIIIFILRGRDVKKQSSLTLQDNPYFNSTGEDKTSLKETLEGSLYEDDNIENQVLLQIAPVTISKDLTEWFLFFDMKKMLSYNIKSPSNERLMAEFILELYDKDGVVEELAFVLASDPRLKLDTSFKLAFILGYDDFGQQESYRLRALVSGQMIDRLDYASPVLLNERGVTLDTNLIISKKNYSYVIAYWTEGGFLNQDSRISLRGGISVDDLLKKLKNAEVERVRVFSVKVLQGGSY